MRGSKRALIMGEAVLWFTKCLPIFLIPIDWYLIQAILFCHKQISSTFIWFAHNPPLGSPLLLLTSGTYPRPPATLSAVSTASWRSRGQAGTRSVHPGGTWRGESAKGANIHGSPKLSEASLRISAKRWNIDDCVWASAACLFMCGDCLRSSVAISLT